MTGYVRLATVATVLALAVSVPVASPAQGEKAEKTSEAVKEEKGAALRVARRSARDADARHCLRFSANHEVIKCAEKYR